MVSPDLLTQGFNFCGLGNGKTSISKVPLECLMLFDGISYRQTFNASYKAAKSSGALKLEDMLTNSDALAP
jgi:hypothetical protein